MRIEHWKLFFYQGIEYPNAYHLTNYATLILREAPTVDAVEVVRCRDCKYWGSGKYCESYCNRYGNMMTDINPDDFCSYGERKDGDKR